MRSQCPVSYPDIESSSSGTRQARVRLWACAQVPFRFLHSGDLKVVEVELLDTTNKAFLSLLP